MHDGQGTDGVGALGRNATAGGRLQCGNARIATSRLRLPALDPVLVAMHAPVPLDPMRAGLPTPAVCTGVDRACWLAAALEPSYVVFPSLIAGVGFWLTAEDAIGAGPSRRPLVFLDTDRLGVEETKKGELIVNEVEATLTTLVRGHTCLRRRGAKG